MIDILPRAAPFLRVAPLALALGAASRGRVVRRWLPQAGLVVCAPLIAAVTYAAWQEHAAVTQLSSFIGPYSPISAVTWAPPAADGSRHWIVMTPDPPARVDAFYENPAHRTGWELLERGAGILVLRRAAARGQACLSIMINRQSGGRAGASIVYALVPKCG